MQQQIKYTELDDNEYQNIIKNGRFSIPDYLLFKYIFFIVITIMVLIMLVAYVLQQEKKFFFSVAFLMIIGIAFSSLFFFIISSFKRTFYFEKFKTGLDIAENIRAINDFFNLYQIEHFPEINHSNIFFSFEQKGRVRFECTLICDNGNILYNARPQTESIINTSITLKMTRAIKKYFDKY
jgi:hypothetical protein